MSRTVVSHRIWSIGWYFKFYFAPDCPAVPTTVTPLVHELPEPSKNLRGCPDTELSDTSKIYSLPLMISIVGLLAPSNLKIFTPPTLATVTT